MVVSGVSSHWGHRLSEGSELCDVSTSLSSCLLLDKQGTTIRVEFGDATTAADPAGSHVTSQAFPHTYGQPLAHFVRPTAKVPDAQIIVEQPAIRVGVVFCRRQSPGGHNVIWGLHSAIKSHNPTSTLLGFVGGTEGLFAKKTLDITDDELHPTHAAQLAETFAELKCPMKVVGVPVTLNGDLKNQFVGTNVGFDTICKVNSQLISNVCTDALSAEKYYYFIRLMGRKASHVALECTLQSHPNMVILGEEVAASKLRIFDVTKQICDAVQARAEKEGLVYHNRTPCFSGRNFLLHHVINVLGNPCQGDISSHLSPRASALFEFLPPFIRKQLLLYPESDDSARLSQTDKLLAQLVESEMNKRLAMTTMKHRSQGPGATPIGKPAIHPATVGLKGKAYEILRHSASSFFMDDIYRRNPGPFQFDGPGTDAKAISLCVEDQDYMGRIKLLQEYLNKRAASEDRRIRRDSLEPDITWPSHKSGARSVSPTKREAALGLVESQRRGRSRKAGVPASRSVDTERNSKAEGGSTAIFRWFLQCC
ncbi:pyrophosphate--fructose 6-phosphate 1-phosphotransferase [Musa troglodytarum]|uniref:Pyrophosphate--fructose 6-phosphate 1-phosphotransferase n=1 Tax=Musa troglodytarum TaxID=320322 RepID=A0A9E7KAE9_9LILI|nr:pyrophosphate--fructose 6-phosphate 1-phosphotransferase [Musa troglodytarum]